ncbi:MAG: DUF3108 domain-containing protein [Burkholderiaceae bacterium]|nr:DUF3108 domain-containing protein [Burkholderiaceae bacterium]
MRKTWVARIVALLMLAAVSSLPALAADHPSVKRHFKLPPPATLVYAVKATQNGFQLKGEMVLRWTASGGRYALDSETRSSLLGKALESRSEGIIDGFGLAPQEFTEKKMRKAPYGASFDRNSRVIRLTESPQTYPIKGGEQDRSSILLQLVAVARGAPQKFTNGSEWKFFVVGRKSAETWTFRVIRRETVKTALGDIPAVHMVRLQQAGSREQQLDVWLAPSLDWFPVRVNFQDADGTRSEQVLQRIER